MTETKKSLFCCRYPGNQHDERCSKPLAACRYLPWLLCYPPLKIRKTSKNCILTTLHVQTSHGISFRLISMKIHTDDKEYMAIPNIGMKFILSSPLVIYYANYLNSRNFDPRLRIFFVKTISLFYVNYCSFANMKEPSVELYQV